MKATELMINDWVIVVEDMNTAYPTRVKEINVYGTMDTIDGDEVLIDGVAPIPLTAKILQKNDIRREILQIWKPSSELDANFSLLLVDDVWIFDYVSIASNLQLTRYKLHYVHELQHALRLCGLNELADNFKV